MIEIFKVLLFAEIVKKDEWLYIIKSGSCRVFKRIRFDQNAFDMYQKSLQEKFSRKVKLDKVIDFINISQTSNYSHRSNQSTAKITKAATIPFEHENSLLSKNKSLYTYLEMNKLVEGDIFGIHDLILDDMKDSFILTSDGVECVLINRIYFLKFLYPEIRLKLKFLLSPYPDDEYFFSKYFHAFQWSNFAQNEKSKAQTLRKTKKK